MSPIELQKQAAGIAACDFVSSGMKIGLGTGSTVKYTVIELGRRIKEDGLEIIGVPTSLSTEKLANDVGIPLAELGELEGLDLVIDGADEFNPAFELIKGGGGALLREKIIAQSSNSMIVVADETKKVDCLGDFPLPIEVTPFSWTETKRQIGVILSSFGYDAEIILRIYKENGEPFITDNGNMILDAHIGALITNPVSLENQLLQLAGVCECGLFNGICDTVILASDEGVKILKIT